MNRKQNHLGMFFSLTAFFNGGDYKEAPITKIDSQNLQYLYLSGDSFFGENSFEGYKSICQCTTGKYSQGSLAIFRIRW